MAANKDGCYHKFYAFMTLLSLKLLYIWLNITSIDKINGLKLYLSSDIGGYTIVCGEMLQFAYKMSTFPDFNLASYLTTLRPILSPKSEYFKSNTA